MKKLFSVVLAVMMAMSCVSVFSAGAVEEESDSAAISFDTANALYVHAVAGSTDSDAWQEWQSEHDEDYNEVNANVKYFFLPSSASDSKVEIFNAFSSDVTVNGTKIPVGESKIVSYSLDTQYKVNADGTEYTLELMKSTAEAAIYINNSNADGNGTDLMSYLNQNKSNSAKATGAIVDESGSIDNTVIKKIKGRGNTSWDKAKKGYNITYDSKVSIGGMEKGKKYSILANYQDDSLSRNRFLYDLSDAVGMPYASDSRYVDFYVNGFYWGSYQMAQKVEAGSSDLVNDIDTKAYLNDDGTINTDFPFVCEVDASANDDDYYVQSSSGNKITIKSPEIDEGEPGYDEVKAYVKAKFDAFYTALRSTKTNLTEYADIESLTKIYLINELGKNWDSGVSSLFFTYKQDDEGNYKFYGSPVWDYDNSLGNANGISYELNNIGVSDYTEYTGWWCRFKGKSADQRRSTNIMNNIARNSYVTSAAPTVWFENFVPAINHFSGKLYNSAVENDFYTSTEYYNLLKGSAEMNYKSGWLLKTGSWIANHSSLTKASFDYTTGTYSTASTSTSYAQDFDGMYNYCVDWFTSRAAWLSAQMYDDYTPTYQMGDVNLDGRVSISDASLLQKYLAEMEELSPLQIELANLDGNSKITIYDVSLLQKQLAEME